jgi:hypothetical protein
MGGFICRGSGRAVGTVDELLEDEVLLDAAYDAQGKRHQQSRVRGREQTLAEVTSRMLILKHVCNWSYEKLEREVRANAAYRRFLPDRHGKSARCQDIGSLGTSDRARDHRRAARPNRGPEPEAGVMIADNLINIGRYLTLLPSVSS